MKNIKWLSIQPLTGGAHLGAEKAFNNKPNCIISHPGFSNANEKWLLEYYKKNNITIPYYVFDKHHFDEPEIDNINYKTTEWYKPELTNEKIKEELEQHFKDIDVITSLCFCSALSMASGSTDPEHSGSTGVQNNNLKFITKFTLETIKPKVYVFENAPALYTDRGEGVREVLNEYALKYGYSVTYVGTNSLLHNNVQYRQRTFAIFWRWPNNKPCAPPMIGHYNNTRNNVVEFLSDIPKWANHNDPVKDDCGKDMILKSPLYKFMLDKFGPGPDGYRKKLLEHNMGMGDYIIKFGLFDEALKYVQNSKTGIPPSVATFKHWREKREAGKGFWDYSPKYDGYEKTPTVYFKSVARNIHPTEERGFTKREYMTLQGFPYDLDVPETESDFCQTQGQNCPVQTSCDWHTEIKKIVEDWDNKRINNSSNNNVYYHNNCKPNESHYENQTSKQVKQKTVFSFNMRKV